MHELSLCQAIVETVAEHAAGRPVRAVHVRIGYLRQVVPDSLQFAWEVLTDSSDLKGAELVIDHVPAVVACRACGEATALEAPLLLCPGCVSDEVDVIAGQELLILAIDVEEAVV